MTRIALLFALLGTLCWGQNEVQKAKDERPRYYRLEFQIKDLESGKVVNSRSQSMILSTDQRSSRNGSVRTGSRVPYTSGNDANSIQYSYSEIGVNIDCRVLTEFENQLDLKISVDVSGIGTPTEPSPNIPPVIRQIRWESNVTVPLKKPTVVFSSDDPASSKRTIQFEVTATPLK